jgi:8-oxo-dGTP pyrophosphatase MutT (NUDIX family)
MEGNPWKTLSSRCVFENPWIRLREDTVINPQGSSGTYTVVEARKLAAGVLALTENEELYLVGQYRYPTKVYSWEIIEGGIEEGEAPLDGIKRELKEEAGLEASLWEELPGGEVHLSNCISDERAVFYVARGLTRVKAEPDPNEILAVKKLPFSEVYNMVLSGEIVDAMTIIAVLRYACGRNK